MTSCQTKASKKEIGWKEKFWWRKISKCTNEFKTHVGDIQRKFRNLCGMATGPMAWWPFHGKVWDLAIFSFSTMWEKETFPTFHKISHTCLQLASATIPGISLTFDLGPSWIFPNITDQNFFLFFALVCYIQIWAAGRGRKKSVREISMYAMRMVMCCGCIASEIRSKMGGGGV